MRDEPNARLKCQSICACGPHKGCRPIRTAGRWSWKSKPAKECVTTHLPNGPAPKMDGARAYHLHLAAGVKRRESPAGRGAWSLVTKPNGGDPGSNRLQCGSWW
jgi:hypothetical protein